MMITCSNCGRNHPLTDDDLAYFYPRFFCLSCGRKLDFKLPDAKILELRHSNDPSRSLVESEIATLPPQTQPRKVAKGAMDLESNG
jgi:hypothetical protein